MALQRHDSFGPAHGRRGGAPRFVEAARRGIIRGRPPVAQWIRATDFGSVGRGFESLRAGHASMVAGESSSNTAPVPNRSADRCVHGRLDRSAGRKPVDPGGHDEVVAREPANRVGRQADDEPAPTDFQFRVVALCLGQQGDPGGQPKASLNVLKVNSRRISRSSICHSPATPAAREPASSGVSGAVPAGMSTDRSRARDSGVIGVAPGLTHDPEDSLEWAAPPDPAVRSVPALVSGPETSTQPGAIGAQVVQRSSHSSTVSCHCTSSPA